MRKFTILFLFFLCLSFSIILIAPITTFAQNMLKQGVYTLSDLNKSPDNLYEVKNISSKDSAYIVIFDEENIIMQTIRLSPNSISYNLVPLKHDYKVVLLGKAEVFIDGKTTK